MYISQVHAGTQQKLDEEGVGFPGAKLTGNWEQPVWVQGLEPWPSASAVRTLNPSATDPPLFYQFSFSHYWMTCLYCYHPSIPLVGWTQITPKSSQCSYGFNRS